MLPIEAGLLLLIVIANSAPVAAAKIFGERLGCPVDCGRTLADGYRLFGASKTWRGLLAAMLSTMIAAVLLGWSWPLGLAMGVAAMVGDLLSSFIKRRLGLAASSQALGLDHLPEALLPLLAATVWFELSGWTIAGLTVAFVGLALALSPVFYRLGVRNRPY